MAPRSWWRTFFFFPLNISPFQRLFFLFTNLQFARKVWTAVEVYSSAFIFTRDAVWTYQEMKLLSSSGEPHHMVLPPSFFLPVCCFLLLSVVFFFLFKFLKKVKKVKQGKSKDTFFYSKTFFSKWISGFCLYLWWGHIQSLTQALSMFE